MNEEMILQHLSYAKGIALSVYGKLINVELAELESYAYLGLIDAVKKYDESRGVPFKSYAYIRIRGAIIDEVRKTSWITRHERLKGEEVKKLVSLELVYEEAGETNIEDEYIEKETMQWIMEQFKILKEREQEAMYLRFVKDLKLKDIAKQLGVSESRASQLVISSLQKLRKHLDF